jgi:hypothetical protein
MIVNIATKRGYDIAAAVRGPDSQPDSAIRDHAKHITTGVIRKKLNVPAKGVMSPKSKLMTTAQAKVYWSRLSEFDKNAVRQYMRGLKHFHSHVVDAFEELDPGYLSWLHQQRIVDKRAPEFKEQR